MTTAQDGGRLSALRTSHLYPQEIFLVLISVRGRVHPRAIVRSEGFYVNPLTPTGIEPATFQFVTQHFNQCATAVLNRPVLLHIWLHCQLAVEDPVDEMCQNLQNGFGAVTKSHSQGNNFYIRISCILELFKPADRLLKSLSPSSFRIPASKLATENSYKMSVNFCPSTSGEVPKYNWLVLI